MPKQLCPYAVESDSYGPLSKKRQTDHYQDVDRLIPDSLRKILQFLTLKEQIRLERVCKLWQSTVNELLKSIKLLDLSDCLPRNALWQYRSGGLDILASVTDRLGSHLISLSIPGGQRGNFGMPELLLLSTKCPLLRHLCFELTIPNLPSLAQLGNHLGKLNSLKLTYPIDRTDDTNSFIERHLGISLSSIPRLKHFEIECPSVAGHGSLEGTFLAALPSSIDSVSLSYLPLISDQLLANFLRSHPGLKRFEMISVCYDIHTSVPELLAQYCTGLKHLKISGWQLFSFSRASSTPFGKALRSLTQLEEVDVAPNCYFNDSDLKILCANCPNVKVLRMGNQHFSAVLSSGAEGTHNAPGLSMDGLIHLGELKNLKFVSLDCFRVNITAEIVTALCEGSGTQLAEFHFFYNHVPIGWRKFTEAGTRIFVRAARCHSRSNFVRIEVDRVGRRVWLKQGIHVACTLPSRMVNIHL